MTRSSHLLSQVGVCTVGQTLLSHFISLHPHFPGTDIVFSHELQFGGGNTRQGSFLQTFVVQPQATLISDTLWHGEQVGVGEVGHGFGLQYGSNGHPQSSFGSTSSSHPSLQTGGVGFGLHGTLTHVCLAHSHLSFSVSSF